MTAHPSKLPPVSVLGIGAVTALGRDLELIAQKLKQPIESNEKIRRVDDELLSDPFIGKKMRRADRFAKMAIVAAVDAWNRAKPACEGVPMERVGLIVSTGFGPHGRGFRFLDGIIDCGDSAALPTDFSHSVHGAAAAYITELLDLRGPALNMADFQFGFENAVLTAQCWLASGTCDRVIVGAADELGEVLLHCVGRMLPTTDSVGATPTSPSCVLARSARPNEGDAGVAPTNENVIPGEGAVFFVVGNESLSQGMKLDASPASPAPLAMASSPRFTESFGLSTSSVAFELLGAMLTSQPGPIDNAATFTPSSATRAASLLLRNNRP